MTAVGFLAILISEVLQKARELSAKIFDMGQIPPQTSKQEPVPKPDNFDGGELFGMLFFADIQPHLINEAARLGYL